jgi:Amt family ammonium transporter
VKRKLAVSAVLLLGLTVALTAPAAAQGSEPVPNAVQALIDNVWVFIAGILVFLMQAGFAFVESGLTRGKSVANIMAKNLSDMCIGALAFFAIGYGLAYGADGGSIIGTDTFFLSGGSFDFLDAAGEPQLTIFTNFFFQVVFAATAVTIASGAMAERTKFAGYLIFSAVMVGFIYPVVVHSFWSGEGIIADLDINGAKFGDFAGSTIVHSAGGWAALMGALILGPRIGRYGKDGRPRAIPGHNIAFVVIGVFILWFGWFGFNPGSELAADEVVMRAGVTTLLAAAAGGFTAGAVIWMKSKALDVAMTANGVLAGLVAITAGTATMNTMGALVTGALAGVIVVYSVLFFDRIRIDDPVGAISVHGICGVWGTLAVGLFARYADGFVASDNSGLVYGGGLDQLAVQAIGVVIVFAWVIGTTGLLFLLLKKVGLLRVSPEEEMEGLDTIEHGTPGYHDDVMALEGYPGPASSSPVYEKV